LQYACRAGVAFNSCQGEVFFNQKSVLSMTPSDYSLQSATVTVQTVSGQNNLTIRGKGISNGYGLGIDKVSLVQSGTSVNLVNNGDFEIPNQNGAWGLYSTIQGWSGSDIEIGQGTIYNSVWTSQIC
jgi:hypothetical protein